MLAEVRAESYANYAWPGPLARLYQHNGLVMALAMAVSVGSVLVLAMLLQRHAVLFAPQPVVPGQGFYNVVPNGVMVGVASIAFRSRCWRWASASPGSGQTLAGARRNSRTGGIACHNGPGHRNAALSRGRRGLPRAQEYMDGLRQD